MISDTSNKYVKEIQLNRKICGHCLSETLTSRIFGSICGCHFFFMCSEVVSFCICRAMITHYLVFFLSLTVNLAFGDVLLIIISLPTSAVIYNLETWPFGEAMCKISYSIRTLSLGKSKEKTIL